ncbi:MAG: hypothetical protein ABGX71_03550 [Methyloprofundus sp.]|uniref:hypothetical protein n=1 Tax=Methyloprofundus sp. TaxID=2020875 RepID=UPI002617F097|nr:hypothetical protein [Methyloprofundus sp.]
MIETNLQLQKRVGLMSKDSGYKVVTWMDGEEPPPTNHEQATFIHHIVGVVADDFK